MNRIKQCRLALHMTQTDVADKLKDTDKRQDVSMVCRYEKGACLPTPPVMEALEEAIKASRYDLYDISDINLFAKPQDAIPGPAPVTDTAGKVYEQRRGKAYLRKCYRMSRKFADTLPADILAVCGYSSWNSWHDACLKRLVGEYGARIKTVRKKAV